MPGRASSLSDLGCPTRQLLHALLYLLHPCSRAEKRLSARFPARFRQIGLAILLNRSKHPTRSRFPLLRPPWMAEVPVLQEQQTGRTPKSDRPLAATIGREQAPSTKKRVKRAGKHRERLAPATFPRSSGSISICSRLMVSDKYGRRAANREGHQSKFDRWFMRT
jgi:hypothetical protein